jgi:Pectate lyase superfamily protein
MKAVNLLSSLVVPWLAFGTSFDVRQLGAKGDGTVKDTQSIQTAIDWASANGGTVVFPPGAYVSGTLHLRSNVTLRIERGAKLVFSPDDADFDAYENLRDRPTARAANPRPLPPDATPVEIRNRNALPSWDDTETSYTHYALLSGDGVHDVSNVAGALLSGNRLSSPAEFFLSVLGGASRAIALRANDLRLAKQEFRKAAEVPPDAVSTDSGR